MKQFNWLMFSSGTHSLPFSVEVPKDNHIYFVDIFLFVWDNLIKILEHVIGKGFQNQNLLHELPSL